MKSFWFEKSEQMYSGILFLYPRSFRKEFGQEMLFIFSEELREVVNSQSPLALVSFFLKQCGDTFKSLIIQYKERSQEGMFMKKNNSSALLNSTSIIRVLAVTIGILFLPVFGMIFSNSVVWGPIDFFVAAVLLTMTGFLFELVQAHVRSLRARIIFGMGIFIAFILIWAELAVGIFH